MGTFRRQNLSTESPLLSQSLMFQLSAVVTLTRLVTMAMPFGNAGQISAGYRFACPGYCAITTACEFTDFGLRNRTACLYRCGRWFAPFSPRWLGEGGCRDQAGQCGAKQELGYWFHRVFSS